VRVRNVTGVTFDGVARAVTLPPDAALPRAAIDAAAPLTGGGDGSSGGAALSAGSASASASPLPISELRAFS
jgi:hypothetical protein